MFGECDVKLVTKEKRVFKLCFHVSSFDLLMKYKMMMMMMMMAVVVARTESLCTDS